MHFCSQKYFNIFRSRVWTSLIINLLKTFQAHKLCCLALKPIPSNTAPKTHPTPNQISIHQLKWDQTLGCYLGKYLLKNLDIYQPELLLGWVFVKEPICIIQLFNRPKPWSKLIPTQYKVFKNVDPGNYLNSYFLQIWNLCFLWEISPKWKNTYN